MKSVFDKLQMFSLLLIALCITSPVRSKAAQSANGPAQSVNNSQEQPVIVGKIGDYIITKEDLRKQFLIELYPNEYEPFDENAKPADANSVLMKMVAEKAMIIEARKQGYLEEDSNNRALKRFRERGLISLLVQNYLQEVKDKITATEPEIQKMIQADPNTDPNRAKLVIENSKARNIVSQYYRQIYEKSNVKKLSENYPQAIQIHDRLLNHPKVPQRMKFIRETQIKDEMTPEERNIVLATYDGGKVTLEDWLNTLCESSPPSRPKNLDTPEGIDQLLERALAVPLYIAQAKLQKLDQDENYIMQVRDYQDRILLNSANSEMYKKVQEPSTEEMIAYFNNNKEIFRVGRFMKIDIIWCQDLETARRVRAELDGGKNFEAVKQEYSLDKGLKPYNTYPGSEGLFWKGLWQAEPNDIAGPIKGFFRQQIKWRIVKILEKNAGELKEYSADMSNRVKDKIMSERREALLAEYRRELLKKHPHEVYPEKIRDIDPLDIP